MADSPNDRPRSIPAEAMPKVYVVAGSSKFPRPGLETFLAEAPAGSGPTPGCSCHPVAWTVCECNKVTVCTCQSHTTCACVSHTSCSCVSHTTCSCVSHNAGCGCVGHSTCSCVGHTTGCGCVGHTYRGGGCRCAPVH